MSKWRREELVISWGAEADRVSGCVVVFVDQAAKQIGAV
jgi:hypothetical protein